MIRYLSIERLAVIDAVEIELEPGFTVLTGETGAGKSILVEALGLLAGARASADLVRTGETQAVVQAIVEAADGTEHILRREISAQGRSRAFHNGALVATAALRALTADLLDLHGQHEHQRLLVPAAHLDLLDAWAELTGAREEVGAAYRAWRDARHALEQARTGGRDRADRLDLVGFQLGEIERIDPQAGEDEALIRTRQVLASADRLQRLCAESYALLYESDGSALSALGQVWKRVDELASLDAGFAPYAEARAPIKSQLEDLAFFLRSYAAGVDASPERLQEIEARLARLEGLKKRFGPTLEEVLARRDALRVEIEALAEAPERERVLEREADRTRETFLERARRLSADRRAAASRFARELEKGLATLAMERTRFEVRFQTGEDAGEAGWSERGIDEAEFYLSPNPGEDLRPLARIASGGELSRVMLAVRTLASTDAPGRTLVFDEVDAGIGGSVAEVVGNRLRALGSRYQVLCVTHLPQIAACGTTHYHIAKQVRGNRTRTTISRLASEARVEEIARMIAGRSVTDAVRTGARELLDRHKHEQTTKGESEKAKAKGRRLG